MQMKCVYGISVRWRESARCDCGRQLFFKCPHPSSPRSSSPPILYRLECHPQSSALPLNYTSSAAAAVAKAAQRDPTAQFSLTLASQLSMHHAFVFHNNDSPSPQNTSAIYISHAKHVQYIALCVGLASGTDFCVNPYTTHQNQIPNNIYLTSRVYTL